MKIEQEDIGKLVLDPDNDRFAELYSGSKDESDLIEYLLYTEAADEIAKNISDRGHFYPDEALWVTPRGKKLLVRDGNRRCAAAKALSAPKKYGLDLPAMSLSKLPVLIYKNEEELERRIQEQHTHSLFREWDRIAKALKAYEMRTSGSSEEALLEIDTNPSQLIKLASFYYEAVKIGGEDLKKLLRPGRGTRGKAIIFERLFAHARLCGYQFKGKPSYLVEIIDAVQFESYITAIVAYLVKNPRTAHGDVDKEKAAFLSRLSEYGFSPKEPQKEQSKETEREKDGEGPDEEKTPQPSVLAKRGSVKNRPVYERKLVAPKLKRLIDECYNLDNTDFANAKVALARVTFESVLKYVVEETKFGGRKLASYSHFNLAFFDKHGAKRKYTNFEELRSKFIALITDTGTRKAFEGFDLNLLHQIVHNYKVGASPTDARTAAENLQPLIEFMLQEESAFIAGLDTSKLK